MKRILCLLAIAASPALSAQGHHAKDTAAFRIGIYAGYYLAGDAPAAYYNGSDNNRLVNMMNQPQIENQIRESLSGYPFSLEEYAQDMRYSGTASFELEASYSFGKHWSIAAHLHNVRLQPSGVFTLRVDRVDPNNSVEPYLEQVPINGKESRSHIGIGLGKRFFLEENFFTLLEAGVDFNFVEVQENKFQVAGRTYALRTYTDPLNPQATVSTTFGSGFYLNAGLGFELASGYGFLIKTTYFRTTINVNNTVKESTNIFVPGIGFTKTF